MARRQRIDSTTAAVKIMTAAVRELTPPAHVPLAKGDLPFWRSVVAEFARTEWTDHQLELAAILARKMRLLRDELAELEAEGFVSETANGSPCQNPRIGGVRMLDTSIMATRRTLALHARATEGETRDVARRRGIAKGVERDNPLADDLLARPAVH